MTPPDNHTHDFHVAPTRRGHQPERCSGAGDRHPGRWQIAHGLAFSIDRLSPALWVLAPVRVKTPAQGLEGHLAGLMITPDHRQVPARRGVPTAASGLSFWLGRRRLSPSRCATSRVGGVGRSCRSGSVPARLSRGPLAWLVDYGRGGFSTHPPIDWLDVTDRTVARP